MSAGFYDMMINCFFKIIVNVNKSKNCYKFRHIINKDECITREDSSYIHK